MKQHYLIGIFMAATILTACTDEDQSISAPQDGVLRATVEGNKISSRAGFIPKDQANAGAFYWSKEDKIGVTTDQASTQFSQMTLTEGIGQSSGSFEGTISGNIQGYAVYPYNESHSISGNTLTYYFKPEYTYTTVDADFATSQQGYGNSFNPAMYGRISNGNVAFKHLGGVCCIKIPTLPTGSNCKLNLISDKKISGTYTTDLSAAEPVITATTTTTDTEKTVTITFSNNNQNTSGVFYVPVPTGDHTLRLKVTNSSQEEVINTALGTFSFTRRFLKELALNNETINGGEAKEVASASNVKDELAKSDIVAVTGEISGTATVEIPASTSTGSNDSKNVIFEKVAEETALTVADNTTSEATSVKELTLSFAANETTAIEKAPSVTITTPQTTTTLAAVSGSLKLKEVTASTAENTLIVGTGVTINTLKVVKGNVRVNNGAVINTITNQIPGDNTKVTIIKETGAQLPDNLDAEKFNVIDAAMADLEETAKNGGSYTLTQDLTGDFTISATQAVTINLNGYKITNKSKDTFTVNKGSTLTIYGNGTVDNVTHQKACIYNNGTVILNGGTYIRSKEAENTPSSSGGNSFYNILNHGDMTIQPGVMISSTGAFSSLIDNGYFSYTSENARNGYVDGTNQPNPSLIINGGTFSGGINTIKNDDGANLTIVDGTFSNTTQATVQNNNVAEIRGGVFNPTASASHAVETKAYATDYNKGQTAISGGTFMGELYLENGKNANTASFNITGGTFSDPSALAYLGDNADVTVKLNADTELVKSMIVEKGTATIDLNNHTLTASSSATVKINNKDEAVVAIAVKDGAKATVKNGKIGDSSNKLSYGVFAFGKANVTLNNVSFSEMVIYAYNGAGELAATNCTFKGWLSGWHNGGKFTGCTFTIGKAYYPATICYGNTVFTNCKFFKNNMDADVYDNSGAPDDDGYYRCNYVVAGCNPTTTIDFVTCKFIDGNNTETSLLMNDHPYHACGWGDGKIANAQIKVDSQEVTTLCSAATSTSN